jgi:hypothetical protein
VNLPLTRAGAIIFRPFIFFHPVILTTGGRKNLDTASVSRGLGFTAAIGMALLFALTCVIQAGNEKRAGSKSLPFAFR